MPHSVNWQQKGLCGLGGREVYFSLQPLALKTKEIRQTKNIHYLFGKNVKKLIKIACEKHPPKTLLSILILLTPFPCSYKNVFTSIYIKMRRLLLRIGP